MKIDYDVFAELCSAYILNTLEESEYKILKDILDSGDETARMIYKQQLRSILYLPETVEPIEPSAEIKTKLFEKIRSEKNGKKDVRTTDDNSKKFTFVTSDQGEWVKHPVEGVYFKLLSVNKEKNYGVMLFKVDADTTFPPHHHTGAEECYVLSGDVHVRDKILGPGDFHHADENSDHGTLYTRYGCSLLIMADLDDYLPH